MIRISPIESDIHTALIASILLADMFLASDTKIRVFISTQTLFLKHYLQIINLYTTRQYNSLSIHTNIWMTNMISFKHLQEYHTALCSYLAQLWYLCCPLIRMWVDCAFKQYYNFAIKQIVKLFIICHYFI